MFYRNFLFGEDSGTSNVIGESDRGIYQTVKTIGESDRDIHQLGKAIDVSDRDIYQPGKAVDVPDGDIHQPGKAISVLARDLYQPGKGYGFVIEKNRREQELLKVSELHSGFDTVYWYQDENLSYLQEDEQGCFLDSDGIVGKLEVASGEAWRGERRRIPLSFCVDVPRQGNYKVTITIRMAEPLKDVMIFTGRRRLAYRGDIPGNTVFSCTMMVNVCDIVPRGQTRIFEDTTIDITVVADRPRISGLLIEEATCPVVYIAGDSTVTDQSADYPYAPGTSYSGWGQMLTAYLNDKIAVSNHAHSGLTTDSFRKEGHYSVIEKYSNPGDFLFIQFGHNDQKLPELKAKEGYQANLLRYISECRDRGVYPVLVTPIARNTWRGNDGRYNDLLEEYAETCKEVGKLTEVPVLDLHGLSMAFILESGLEGSKPYFFPDDYTHSNDYGAYYMAGLVAREIQSVCAAHPNPAYQFLAKCVTGGFGSWEPEEVISAPVKPKRYENLKNPEENSALLQEIDDLDRPADRVAVLDMLIKTARFFPTNVYNDMFQDVLGHEWYAGIVECAYQNGMVNEGLVENRRFCPDQPVTMEEFLVFAMNAYRSRKALPKEKDSVYDSACRDFARPYVQAAFGLGLIASDGSTELDRVITRGEAVELCRKLKI